MWDKKVVKVGESEGDSDWASTPVWFEGGNTPLYVYSEDVEVAQLMMKLQNHNLPEDVQKLMQAYGEACRNAGWHGRDRNQADCYA